MNLQTNSDITTSDSQVQARTIPTVPPIPETQPAIPQQNNDPREVFDWLTTTVRPAVDDRIEDHLGESQFADRLLYQVRTGGKRLRPGLVVALSNYCDLNRKSVLDIAAGIELLHTYSLVHDDLVDRDDERREEPTLWQTYGEADAVNIGDMLLARALEVLPSELTDVAPTVVRRMTEGQQLDFDFDSRRDLTVSDYRRMVWKKTGVLFSFALAAPFYVSETSLPIDLEAIGQLWIAFQMRDDLLDLESGNGTASFGNDIRAGKRTVMAIHADDPTIYEILETPAVETTQDDVEAVVDRYRNAGSIAFTRRRMNDHATTAIETLDGLSESPVRRRLRALCDFTVQRGTESEGE